ncbi:MAG: ABC transporter permease [Acidobacteriia bacterium]|nr:ABC transporter permease [Terriglobia bacterium]
MRFLWSAAIKDVRRRLRDPLALLLWLVIPLAIASLIALAFGGQEGPQLSARLLVADEDGSLLSSLLVRSFGQFDAGNLVQTESVAQETGRTRLEQGDGSALLVIPRGFAAAVLNQQPTRLLLVTNPEQRILPGILKEGLEMLTDAIAYLQQLFGKELREMAAGPGAGRTSFPDATIARLSISINRFVQRQQKYLFPPVIEIETTTDQAQSSEINFSLLFLPMILLMALTFTTLGLSDDYWQERDRGTLARTLTTPGGVPGLLAGKMISALIISTLLSSVILAIGMAYLSLPFGVFPLAVAWSAATGALLLALFLLLQTLAPSRQTASVLVTSLVFPLLMLGGSFFPLETMPGWMAAVGRWTPNGWAAERLKDILLKRADPVSITIAFAVFLVACMCLLFLSARRIRHVLAGR